MFCIFFMSILITSLISPKPLACEHLCNWRPLTQQPDRKVLFCAGIAREYIWERCAGLSVTFTENLWQSKGTKARQCFCQIGRSEICLVLGSFCADSSAIIGSFFTFWKIWHKFPYLQEYLCRKPKPKLYSRAQQDTPRIRCSTNLVYISPGVAQAALENRQN
jgi:hypothetical protein